jgi:hypothetical protein
MEASCLMNEIDPYEISTFKYLSRFYTPSKPTQTYFIVSTWRKTIRCNTLQNRRKKE